MSMGTVLIDTSPPRVSGRTVPIDSPIDSVPTPEIGKTVCRQKKLEICGTLEKRACCKMPVPVIAKPRKGLWQSVFPCIGGRIPTTSLRTGLGMTRLKHFATGSALHRKKRSLPV